MKSRIRRYLPVILVNLAIVALIEFGCAMFIRKHFKKANEEFLSPRAVEHPFAIATGYEMKANAVIADSRGVTKISTDDKGHAIVPDALPHPRFTLAVLGGSRIIDIGVNNNAENVPSQLQTILRKEYGIDVNVINLAARGYVSLQELLVLNKCLAEQPLDMVVSVSGHNDLMRYLGGDSHPSFIKRPNSPAEILVRKVEAGNLVVSNLIPALRRISRTANLLALVMESRAEKAAKAKKTTKDVTETPKPETPKNKPVSAESPKTAAPKKADRTSTFIKAHLANYAMMKAVCDVHHTAFKLYFQPNMFTKASLSDQERSYILNKDCSGLQANLDALISAHRNYRSSFDAMPMSFPYTDLAGAFEKADTVFLDSCHYNEDGATQLARVIAADLAPIIRSQLAEQKSQP